MSVNASESGSRQPVQNHRNLEIFSDAVRAVSVIATTIFIILPVAHVPIGLLGTYGPLAANAILLIVIIAKAAVCKSSTSVGQKKSTSTSDKCDEEVKEQFQGWGKISESEQDAIDFGDKLDKIKKKGQANPLTESEKAELVILLKDVVLELEKLKPDTTNIIRDVFLITIPNSSYFSVYFHKSSFEPLTEVYDALKFYLVQNFKNVEFYFGTKRSLSSNDPILVVSIEKRENLGAPNN